MKCFFCGRNKKTTISERRDFNTFGYYTPSWYVLQGRVTEEDLEDLGINPNDDEHFLCWDCLYNIENRNNESFFELREPSKVREALEKAPLNIEVFQSIYQAKKSLDPKVISLLRERYINPDEKYIKKVVDTIYLFARGYKPPSPIKEEIEECREILLEGLQLHKDYKNYSLLARKDFLLSTITLYWGSELLRNNPFPLEEFNKEFSQYLNSKLVSSNISFKIEGPKNSLINGASYFPYNRVITLSVGVNTFLYLYLGLDKDIFLDDFIAFYTHENTHLQQDQLNFHKQPVEDTSSISPDRIKPLQLDAYLSQKSETDAYARYVACNINKIIYYLRDEVTYQELGDMLSQGNVRGILSIGVQKNLIDSTSLLLYDRYKRLPPKVFKRFLKRVMDYFDDQSKGKYDYKNWLLSKKPVDLLKESQERILFI